MTGFPWAPILVVSDKHLIFFAFNDLKFRNIVIGKKISLKYKSNNVEALKKHRHNFTYLTAASISSTSIHTWCIPPFAFFFKNPAMGDDSPENVQFNNFY